MRIVSWSSLLYLSVAIVCGTIITKRRRQLEANIKKLQEELNALQINLQQKDEELKRQTQLRQDERAGRIALETKLRKEKQQHQQESGYHYYAIGVVESPFPDRRGTPRQPLLVPAATGLIRFNKKLIQYAHYAELEQFSHVWVLFQFHENTNVKPNEKLRAKIRPPRLHGERVGCLSTRSPHRPNAIGLSVCEVVRVSEEGVFIKCLDMVNGTPVIDGRLFIFMYYQERSVLLNG
jgi:tRNA (adenine37-N6)-methyltransferase